MTLREKVATIIYDGPYTAEYEEALTTADRILALVAEDRRELVEGEKRWHEATKELMQEVNDLRESQGELVEALRGVLPCCCQSCTPKVIAALAKVEEEK